MALMGAAYLPRFGRDASDELRTSFGSNEGRPITADCLTETSPLPFLQFGSGTGGRSDSMNRLDLYAGKIYE